MLMHANILATASFEEILDDLSTRFIINVPEAELKSPHRICFQVEQAHWFYEDFVRLLQPSLPSFQLKTFSEKIFKHCPLLKQWAHQHERAYADFMQYRFRIPVCGAIILNENLDKCVLVKGWSSKSGWSFPRGKINQDEEYDHCAIREVLEETGYDISPLIKDTYLECTIREQSIRLYVICGVPEDTNFQPQTRKEISQVEWFKLDELPGLKPGSRGRFYMVVPFVSKLKTILPALRKEHLRAKGGGKPSKNKPNGSRKNLKSGQKNAGQPSDKSASASPPSPPGGDMAAASSAAEPSAALKSLLGISAAPTPPNEAPEPSSALKSLLGIQQPSSPDQAAANGNGNGHHALQQLQQRYAEPEQQQQQQQQLPQSAPPPPLSEAPAAAPDSSTHPLLAILRNADPRPTDEQQAAAHPLMAMLKTAQAAAAADPASTRAAPSSTAPPSSQPMFSAAPAVPSPPASTAATDTLIALLRSGQQN